MLFAITGANGFLGRATVDAALRAGHRVRALVRTPQGALWAEQRAVTTCVTTLEDGPALRAALAGVDAVIHIAAAKGGDYSQQYTDTVGATEQLLVAMDATGVSRLVAVSSFSIYDYTAMPPQSLLTEASPLAAKLERRDAYAQVKRQQEDLVRAWGARQPAPGGLSVVRPGLIYGQGQLWSFAVGQALGARRWLAMTHDGEMPWTYVENCADALIAATSPQAVGGTFNIVDDERPSARQWLRRINTLPGGGKTLLPFPLGLLRSLAALASGINHTLCGGKLRLPGLLVSERVDARFKPLHYSNAHAKATLGWRPAIGLEEALLRSAD